MNPLLHTWSLGVEGQFYLVFPLAFLLAKRFLPSKMLRVAVALFIIFGSLAAWVYATEANPSSAFFLPHLRAWEIMLGVLAALVVDSGERNRALVYAGITLVGFASLLSLGAGRPEYMALLVTLVVSFFLSNQGAFLPLRILLGMKIFLGLGRISYGLYLFHFPIFLFLSGLFPESLMSALLKIFLTLCFATLSYLFLEAPLLRIRKSFGS